MKTAPRKIFKGLAPAPGEHVIKKHRYSGFYGTDLENHPQAVGHHSGHHIWNDDRELLPRDRARQPCFGIIKLSFYLTQPAHSIIQMSAGRDVSRLADCRRRVERQLLCYDHERRTG